MNVSRHFLLAFLTIVAITLGFGLSDANATGKKPDCHKNVKGKGHHGHKGKGYGHHKCKTKKPSKPKYKKPRKPSKPTTTNNNSVGQSQNQGQSQGQTAYGGSSYSNAQGGNASQGQSSVNENSNSLGQSADSSAINEGNSTTVGGDTNRSVNVQLPPPVQAAVIPASSMMCALSSSQAGAIGWNFASWGGSKQTVDALCRIEQQAVALERMCKIRAAVAYRVFIAQEAAKRLDIDHATVPMNTMTGEMYADDNTVTTRISLSSAFKMFMAEAQTDKPWTNERNALYNRCNAPRIIQREVVRETPMRSSSETYKRAQRFIAGK